MSVGFGFSVGDFIAGVQFIAKVVNGLRATAGSSDDYQLNRAESLQLQEHLQRLQRISPSFCSTTQLDHIHHRAQDCEETLQSFLTKTSKFDGALGPSAAGGWHHGCVRKAQWALSSAASKFREIFARKLSLLHQEMATVSLYV